MKTSLTWLKVVAGLSFFMAACQAVISISPVAAAYFEAPKNYCRTDFCFSLQVRASHENVLDGVTGL
jgi:hypothetical protein